MTLETGQITKGTDPANVIADLIALAQALQFALDDAEEIEQGRHLIDAEHITNLLAVIERLDALPDDKPGYTMDFPGKAQWALRDVQWVATNGHRLAVCGFEIFASEQPGQIYIRHESGELGSFNAGEFGQAIAEFFRKHCGF